MKTGNMKTGNQVGFKSIVVGFKIAVNNSLEVVASLFQL